MYTVNISDTEIEKLKDKARKLTSIEEMGGHWSPYEYSEGSYDDCYFLGEEDTNINNARKLLEMIGVDYL